MQHTPASGSIFATRSAGVLLHPTSLPCSESCFGDSAKEAFGNLGKDAYRFVDFMVAAGIKVWQMLPTGPTQDDMSPYQSFSAHAGNPDLISFDWFVEKGWFDASSISQCAPTRQDLASVRKKLSSIFFSFIETEQGAEVARYFDQFCTANNYWLDDFSLFSAIRHSRNNQGWTQWPEDLRTRQEAALKIVRKELKGDIAQIKFEQFTFFSQWHELRHYAKERGVYFFGDMPIFVGHDSADVWAQQHYFQLDAQGNPTSVAGVPPDYFSETGQHWGNPHYAWDVMEADGFQWWLARIKTQAELFDFLRIDHFRGFEAYWSIPGDTHDARTGHWVKAPGEAFLKACFNAFPNFPLVAENLGVITDEVEALRQAFNLPGMLVLQFAFDGNTNNPHLPHNHTRSDVIYSGTHDNDTTLGWFEKLAETNRQQLTSYCFNSTLELPWLLINLAFSSVGRMAIIPMQDFMELDGRHRMNMPGTTDKNWVWKFNWDQVDPSLATRIRQQLISYNRLM